MNQEIEQVDELETVAEVEQAVEEAPVMEDAPAAVDASVAADSAAEAEAPAVAEVPVAELAKVFPPRRNLGAGAGRPSAAVEASVTAGGLAASRAAHWHQDGNGLLTREAAASWIEQSGLVFYTPRAQQMGSPAPSMVEAVAGKADAESADAALVLLEALVAEGKVVPLNLLGVTGAAGTETPDFVCSAAVFSFIFTLRGNKAWKTAPATSGAVKVSPLALAAYEILTAKGAMTAYDLTTELGKEVTGTAVLRALNELWAQLRVLPLVSSSGANTQWELASARFTRQIKAGANAGQPTALSALVSLYLGQAMAAEETEVESFLSPLAPRSRVREVLHALLGARQLETVVVDGKTLLHVTGAAPVTAEAARPEAAEEGAVAEDGGGRIAKFTPKSGGKLGTGMRAKTPGMRPAGRPGGARPSSPRPAGGGGGRPAFGKFAGRGAAGDRPQMDDRERRPFRKPAFDKPWEDRLARPARPYSGDGDARPPRRDAGRSFGPPAERGGDRPFSKGPGFAGKREGGFAPRGGSRPPFTRSAGGEGRPERTGGDFKRPYTPRPRPEGGEDRPRPAYGKPAFGGRPAGKFQDRRPGPGATGAYPSRPRPEAAGGEGEAPRKVFRKFDAPRENRPYKAKPFGAGPARSAGPRSAGPRSSGPRPEGAGRPPARGGSFAGREDGGARPYRSGSPREGAGEGGGSRRPPARPAGPGRNAPFPARSGGAGKPAGGPFAKFAGGKRPFGKSAGRGKPAPKSLDGGFKPTQRKRPEDE